MKVFDILMDHFIFGSNVAFLLLSWPNFQPENFSLKNLKLQKCNLLFLCDSHFCAKIETCGVLEKCLTQ